MTDDSDIEDPVFGDYIEEDELEALATGWTVDEMVDTGGSIRVTFSHDSTGATLEMTEIKNRTDLPYYASLEIPSEDDDVFFESDYPEGLLQSVGGAMEAFNFGVQASSK